MSDSHTNRDEAFNQQPTQQEILAPFAELLKTVEQIRPDIVNHYRTLLLYLNDIPDNSISGISETYNHLQTAITEILAFIEEKNLEFEIISETRQILIATLGRLKQDSELIKTSEEQLTAYILPSIRPKYYGEMYPGTRKRKHTPGG